MKPNKTGNYVPTPRNDLERILEDHIKTHGDDIEPKDTYTPSHKKYWLKNRDLIMARRRAYQRQYKAQWYRRNRARLLAEAKARRENKAQLELNLDP